jgi:phosphatidylserine decarboxylase
MLLGYVAILMAIRRQDSLAAWLILGAAFIDLNVHVQRLPLAGTIIDKVWRLGAHHAATSPRTQRENHELSTHLQTRHGPCVVAQRAGLVARRIVNWVDIDSEVDQGQRLGMIKFGSQTALRLTTAFEPLVDVGHRVAAGVTPVAVLHR